MVGDGKGMAAQLFDKAQRAIGVISADITVNILKVVERGRRSDQRVSQAGSCFAKMTSSRADTSVSE